MQFATADGLHPLEVVSGGTICGTYLRDADTVCVVSLYSVEEGRGHLTAFLDALPNGVTFDNVVHPVLEGALRRRGYGIIDDSQNLWGRI